MQKEDIKKQIKENFENQCNRMKNLGYNQSENIIPISKATILSFIITIPIIAIVILTFILINRKITFDFNTGFFIISFIVIVLATLIHELLHGITWSIFCKEGFKSIRFGLMKPSMTPYCNCKELLELKDYALGTIAPLIVLGIIPAEFAIILDSTPLLIFSIFNILSAGADILILIMAIRNHNAIIIDHPSDCGFIAFNN